MRALAQTLILFCLVAGSVAAPTFVADLGKIFKSTGKALSSAVNSLANKITGGNVQSLAIIGDCDVRTLQGLIHGREIIPTSSQTMIPSIPVKKSVSHILDVVPASKVAGVVSLENLFQPALYYLFASYTGFTSFANRDIVRSMSGITVNGKPFYTGQFELVHTREMSTNSSILTNGRMSLYKMFTNQNQKLIVMSWRGSANPADYSADVASKIGVKPDSRYYKKTVCPYTGNENRDFFVAKGFADTLTTDVLKEVVEDLNKAKSAHPGFKTVIAGHSLGAAKALLATQYLRLNHPNITIDALYTYGQPVTGSTKFNDYVARCIGPEKYVRVVSSDDIIPWFGTTEIKQHSSLVKEVFAPDFNQPKFVTCQGPHDTRCSAGASCKRKSWTHHSLYAGLSVSTDLASIRD